MLRICLFLLLLGTVDGTARCALHRGWAVERAVDGDTVALPAAWLPAGLGSSIHIRLQGIDCPESHRPNCESERAAGLAAKLFTATALQRSAVHDVWLCGWDKYGGRVLGDVTIRDATDHFENLTTLLLRNGHAVEYAGSGPRRDWCSLDTCQP